MCRFMRERALGAMRRVIGAAPRIEHTSSDIASQCSLRSGDMPSALAPLGGYGVRALPLRGLGLPSSYYGYLMKVKRPAQGRRRVRVLPYSEL